MKSAAIFGLRARWKDAEPFAREGAIITQAGSPPAKAEAVLIFGGDGTVNRHLPKLVEHQLPTLIVPVGSGNDFARSIGITNVRDALNAWRNYIRTGTNTRMIDIGVVSPDASESSAQQHGDASPSLLQRFVGLTRSRPQDTCNRLFCCIGGTGFDSETNRRANALPSWVRAHGGYVIAAARTLATWKPVQIRVELPEKSLTLDEPASFVVFANAPSYGDGMRIAPHASLDDGLLDVCFVRAASRTRITRHFASIYSGSHLTLREVEYFQVSRLRVHTERPLDVYADGEFMCQTPVDVTVRPKALKVIV